MLVWYPLLQSHGCFIGDLCYFHLWGTSIWCCVNMLSVFTFSALLSLCPESLTFPVSLFICVKNVVFRCVWHTWWTGENWQGWQGQRIRQRYPQQINTIRIHTHANSMKQTKIGVTVNTSRGWSSYLSGWTLEKESQSTLHDALGTVKSWLAK